MSEKPNNIEACLQDTSESPREKAEKELQKLIDITSDTLFKKASSELSGRNEEFTTKENWDKKFNNLINTISRQVVSNNFSKEQVKNLVINEFLRVINDERTDGRMHMYDTTSPIFDEAVTELAMKKVAIKRSTSNTKWSLVQCLEDYQNKEKK